MDQTVRTKQTNQAGRFPGLTATFFDRSSFTEQDCPPFPIAKAAQSELAAVRKSWAIAELNRMQSIIDHYR
jgi:hypothetical protein